MTDGCGLLGLEPDHETRTIHQIDHRQMEGLGEVDPAHHLLAGVCRPRSAIVKGIARKHEHGAALKTRKPYDDRAAEIRTHFEERALVDDRVDDGPHLVDLTAVAWHGVEQRFLRAL